MSESDGPDEEVGPDEAVGSAADEAARLLGAVADWARERAGDGPAGWGTAFAGLAGQAGGDAHDVDAHLATAATSLAQAAAALLATDVSEGRGAGVEQIDLDGEWPDDEGPEGEE